MDLVPIATAPLDLKIGIVRRLAVHFSGGVDHGSDVCGALDALSEIIDAMS